LTIVGIALAAGAVVATAAASTGFWRSGGSSPPVQATLRTGAQPLTTGFLLDANVKPTDQVTIAKRIASVGSRIERIHALWGQIAPATRSKSFDAQDPGDHHYRWRVLDTEVKNAVAAGLQPILTVTGAPAWTERQGVNTNPYGANDPTPSDFGDFATAIARRYSGNYYSLPRVRYWEVWNEPNVSFYFVPQTAAGPNDTRVDVAAGLYRNLLNAFADAVHAVDPSNVVAGGALGPFTIRGVGYVETTGGVLFERELFCMSLTGPPVPTCHTQVHLDALSFHPYTSGNPTHKAYKEGDLSLGNMPEARAVLAAAIKAGNVVSSRPVQMWVTEFSWDTDPPDPHAVPMKLHERWVAEALYRMWQSGVSMLIWFQVADLSYPGNDYQSGLWFYNDEVGAQKPKPSLLAFRFPFVAYPDGNRVSVWGRTEAQQRALVTIQSNAGGNWVTVAHLRANRYGVFRSAFGPVRGTLGRPVATGSMRAVVDGVSSLPFALTPPKNENMFVTPFGVGAVK
jgi:hypothetical protein